MVGDPTGGPQKKKSIKRPILFGIMGLGNIGRLFWSPLLT